MPKATKASPDLQAPQDQPDVTANASTAAPTEAQAEPEASQAPSPSTDEVCPVLAAATALEGFLVALEALQAEQPAARTFDIGSYRCVVQGGTLLSVTAR